MSNPVSNRQIKLGAVTMEPAARASTSSGWTRRSPATPA